ncbi:putative esterase family protein [Mycobacterium avium subsp. avium 2285 (R)]|nr:putative esterase family protein [Mycobacterium avium subsp. avium 2285 (R)]
MSEPQEAIIPPDFSAPFDREIGLQFTELSPDGARARLEVTPKLLQPMGLVHGGVYCSMIESMASVAAYTWLATRGGGNVVGVNNNTDFLRSIGSGTVYGVVEPIHRGRSQQLWLVTITDDDDRVVARVRCGCRISRFAIPDRRTPKTPRTVLAGNALARGSLKAVVPQRVWPIRRGG